MWCGAVQTCSKCACVECCGCVRSVNASSLLSVSSITTDARTRANIPQRCNNNSSAVAETGDRLATIGMLRKVGGCCAPFRGRAGSPSNTMSPGPRPTSVPPLRGPAVVRRSLAGVLSLSCARPVADWRPLVGKPSVIGQPTRPTQPFILSGSINE